MTESGLRKLSKDGSVHVTDEFYNTLISSLGAAFFLCGGIVLVWQAWLAHHPLHLVAYSIYSLSLFALFVISALHHGLDGSATTEHRLLQLDYFAIFIAIAGHFAPLCLILTRNWVGWTVLSTVWGLAIIGIIAKAVWPQLPRGLSLFHYTLMGWLGLAIVYEAYPILAFRGVGLIVLGGFFFGLGSVIYYRERPNPVPGRFGFHEIWHLCVVAGTVTLYAVIYRYTR